VTAVYVTHDQEEAMTIADRVAVFMEGRIVQIGRPQEIFARPASAIVAGFIGSPPMNLMPAEVHDDKLTVAGIDVPIDRPLGRAGPVTLGVRPAALRIAANGLPARVYLVENLGDTTIVDLDIGGLVIKLRTEQPPSVRRRQRPRHVRPRCHAYFRARRRRAPHFVSACSCPTVSETARCRVKPSMLRAFAARSGFSARRASQAGRRGFATICAWTRSS